MENCINLHVHSDNSVLDGMCQIDELVLRAKELGQKAIAITDHGTIMGMYDLYKACKKHDIQPIYGIEFYMRHDDFDKTFHVIAFAKSMRGLRNLYKLQLLSYNTKKRGKPTITLSDLIQHNEDVIVTTACIGGIIPYCILQNNYGVVLEVLTTLMNVFQDDFYIELQSNTIKEQKRINRELQNMATAYDIKTILTSDTHYILKSDAQIHEMLLCMQTQNKMSNEQRFKFPTNDFWLKDYNELFTDAHGLTDDEKHQALLNTNLLADKCRFELEIPSQSDVLPKYDDNENMLLRELVNTGWREKKHGKGQIEKDRTNFELDVIETKGYGGYYLIVADYINWARDNGIIVGGGRGSGAGSFVAYLCGLSTINPIKHGLLFERFLNPERNSNPD